MKSKIAEKAWGLYDLLPPPVRRHVFAGLVWLILAAFPAGMIYQTFQATVATAGENRKSIKAVEKTIGEIKSQQGILIERSAAAERQAAQDRKKNEENQKETRGLLYDIIGRLPERENGRPAR